MNKVLVYCPLNPETPGIHQRTRDSIFAMEWDGQADIVFGKHDREYPRRDQNVANRNIKDKYNQAREIVLNGDYEALFTIEADIIPPPRALDRLANIDADVAYGLYVSRHGKHPWLTLSKVTEQVRGSKGLGETWGEREKMWGNVIETAGVGLGCTLIRREVLEAVSFRVKDEWIANDWYFAIDAKDRNFTQKHDCGVICGHIDGYRTLWPDISQGWRSDEKKINYQELLTMANGKYIALTILDMGDRFVYPGEKIELADDIAKLLLKKRAIEPRQESGVKPAKREEKKEVKDNDTNN